MSEPPEPQTARRPLNTVSIHCIYTLYLYEATRQPDLGVLGLWSLSLSQVSFPPTALRPRGNSISPCNINGGVQLVWGEEQELVVGGGLLRGASQDQMRVFPLRLMRSLQKGRRLRTWGGASLHSYPSSVVLAHIPCSKPHAQAH